MNKIAAGYLATEKRILEGYNDAKKKFDLGQPTAPLPKETDLRESQKKEIRQKLRTINFEVKWPKLEKLESDEIFLRDNSLLLNYLTGNYEKLYSLKSFQRKYIHKQDSILFRYEERLQLGDFVSIFPNPDILNISISKPENKITWKKAEKLFDKFFNNVNIDFRGKKKFHGKLRAAFTKAFQGLSNWVERPLIGTDVPVNDLIGRGKNLHALRVYQDHEINLVKAHQKSHHNTDAVENGAGAKKSKSGSDRPLFNEAEDKEFMTLTVHDYDREYRHFNANQEFIRYKLWDDQKLDEVNLALEEENPSYIPESGQRLATEADENDEFTKFIDPPIQFGTSDRRTPTPKGPTGLFEDKPKAENDLENETDPLTKTTPTAPKDPKPKGCCGGGASKQPKNRENQTGQTASKVSAVRDDPDAEDDAGALAPTEPVEGKLPDAGALKDMQAETKAEEERTLGAQNGKLIVSGGYYIHENLVQFPYATDAIPFLFEQWTEEDYKTHNQSLGVVSENNGPNIIALGQKFDLYQNKKNRKQDANSKKDMLDFLVNELKLEDIKTTKKIDCQVYSSKPFIEVIDNVR